MVQRINAAENIDLNCLRWCVRREWPEEEILSHVHTRSLITWLRG